MVLLATGSSIGRLRGIVWLVLLNGICTAVAYATHYHALELGPVAVVSPISAAFAVPAIALCRHRAARPRTRPAPLEIAGIAVTLVGVMLVSTDLRALRAGIRGHPAGLPWAIVSAFGFGLAAFLPGYVSLRAGWIVGLWASRMAQVACYVPFVLARPRDMGRLRTAGRTAITLALAAGAADIVGVTA